MNNNIKYDLSILPKLKDHPTMIDWNASIGIAIPFVYDDLNDILTIQDIIKDDSGLTKYIILNYNGTKKKYSVNAFREHNIKRLLVPREQKYNIGDIIQAKNSKMLITGISLAIPKNKNNTITQIRYEVKCLKCGYIYRKKQANFTNTGCQCCSGFVLIPGLNDIPTTNPEMVPYFQNGYKDAVNYTRSSQQKIIPICPYCGKLYHKPIKISHIYENLSKGYNGIGCMCTDGKSFPEKFVFNFLQQLNVNFEIQKTSTDLFGISNKKYDFYIKDKSCIIETHGLQHYEETSLIKRTLKEEQENDYYKYLLAKNNGIKNYIVLDCRVSSMQWIRNSIINSSLPKLLCFEHTDIDWQNCLSFASKNLVKEVCSEYKSGSSISEIKIKYKISQWTAQEYLKIGNQVGWCRYNPQISQLNYKPIIVYRNNKKVGVFKGLSELEKKSVSLFGVHLYSSDAKKSINNNSSYHGFTFAYITDPQEKEAILYGNT